MNEQSKLSEATYFYNRMRATVGNREHFLYNLSALLSAARSVLQYAFKEAQPRGRQWYNNHISNEVLRFFKDKRNINIHTEPIQVNQNISMQLTEVIRISDSINIRINPTEKSIDENSSGSSEPTSPSDISPIIAYKFTFPDWNGDEDVLQLCDKYLKELQRVITDGQDKGFLKNNRILTIP